MRMTTRSNTNIFDSHGQQRPPPVSSKELATTTEFDWTEDLPEDIAEVIRSLVPFGRDGTHSLSVDPLGLGGNNRVFLVDSGDSRYVAKWYYDDSTVFRERMRAEFDFLEHMWHSGVRCVPRPIACDSALHVAVYEHVAGIRAPPSPGERARPTGDRARTARRTDAPRRSGWPMV